MPQVGAADPRASPGAGAIKASESRQRPAVGVPGGDGAAVSVSGRFPAGACRRSAPPGAAAEGLVSRRGRRPRPQQGACQRRQVSCLSGARVPVLRPSLRRDGHRAGRRSGGAVGDLASAADAHRRVSRRPRPAHPQQYSRPPGQRRGGHGGLGGAVSRHRPRHVIQVGRRPQLAASPGQRGKNRDSHPTAGHFRNGKPGNGREAVPASGGSAGIAQRRRGWRGDFPPV